MSEIVEEPKEELKEEKKLDRGEYFKLYYKANRAKQLARLTEKLQCKHCKRMVTYSFMHKHIKSKICMKNRPEVIKPEINIEALKEQIKAELLEELQK